jgi:hypothetical protein
MLLSLSLSLSLSLPIGPISAIYHFIFRRAARSLLEIQISLSLLVRLTRESQSTLADMLILIVFI